MTDKTHISNVQDNLHLSFFPSPALLYLMRQSFVNNNVKQYPLPGQVPAVFFQKYFAIAWSFLVLRENDWAEVTQLVS